MHRPTTSSLRPVDTVFTVGPEAECGLMEAQAHAPVTREGSRVLSKGVTQPGDLSSPQGKGLVAERTLVLGNGLLLPG